MLGIDDEKFVRGKIPMTKREIRILTLANAALSATDTVVDVGAGTGSISIEAAKIAANGHVFAIEKNPDAIKLISQNAEKFDVKNLTILNAEAPAGIPNLPQIDVAIIGGSGGFLVEILKALDAKLKIGGRIVINSVTIQSLTASFHWLKTHNNYRYNAILAQISRIQNFGLYDMARALNPVHIVTAKKIHSAATAKIISIIEAKPKITQAVSKGGLNFA